MPYRPLGAFRLSLALLVMLQHYLQWCFPGPLQRAVMPYEPGGTAVLVFFVLSGFVIAEAADCVYRERPIAFVVNRALRIVPLFAVATALCFLSLAAAGHHPEALTARNLIGNFLSIVPLPGRLLIPPDYGVLRIAWALRYEAAFYAAMAFVIAASSILFDLRRTLLAFCAAILAMTALGFFMISPLFIAGAALYLATIGSWIAIPLALAGLALSSAWDFWPLFVPLIAIATVLSVASTRPLKLDRRLGNLSYPVYLGHWIPLAPFDHAAPPVHPWLVLAAGLVTPIVLAACVEPAVSRLRDAVRGRRLHAADRPVPVA